MNVDWGSMVVQT